MTYGYTRLAPVSLIASVDAAIRKWPIILQRKNKLKAIFSFFDVENNDWFLGASIFKSLW